MSLKKKYFQITKSKTRDHILFTINGTTQKVSDELAFEPLTFYLRKILFATGTKVVCAEGDCGACAVLAAWPGRPNVGNFKSPFRLLNACIAPVYTFDGASVVTIEGLQNSRDHLSALQQAFCNQAASQCGYCTPGFVSAATYLCEQYAEKDQDLSKTKIKNLLTGNLCRCTGYESIIQAVEQGSRIYKSDLCERYLSPSVVNHLKATQKSVVKMNPSPKHELFMPVTGAQVSLALSHHLPLKIGSSNTDLGVIHNKEKIDLHRVLNLSKVKDLYQIKVQKNGITIGARVDLESLRRRFENISQPISDFLNIFASPPIRSTATLIGNIANASPIADTTPWVLLLGGFLEVHSKSQKRKIPLDQFFQDYKKTALKNNEWVHSIFLNRPSQTLNKYLRLYKISTRRDLDISAMNMAISLIPKDGLIQDFRLCLGGVGPITRRDYLFEKQMIGLVWDKDMIQKKIKDHIEQNIKPISDHRGSKEFRLKLIQSLIEKYLLEIFNMTHKPGDMGLRQ
jgi:xanthine dehydrogenase small subunit